MAEKEPTIEERLRAPFPPECLRPRIVAENVNAAGERWVTLTPALDIEDVEDRLDQVVPGWSLEVLQIVPTDVPERRRQDGAPTKGYYVLARLSAGGVTRDGVGVDRDVRAAVSMAFKNAALRFGVGRYLRGKEWTKSIKIRDETAYRRAKYRIEHGLVTWDEALELLRGDGAAAPQTPQPRPQAQPAARRPAQEAGGFVEEEVPF